MGSSEAPSGVEIGDAIDSLRAAGFRIIDSSERPFSTLGELWKHRELLFFLVWRDVKVRYKQTTVGVVWAVIQPVLLMLLFTALLGRVLKVQTGHVPYPVFVFAGLLPWQLFSAALSQSTSSLIADEKLISRVYFPRILIPVASVLAGLVDFVLGFVVLVGFLVYYGLAPGWTVLALPAFLLLAVVAALGLGIGLSALNVRYRDVQYTIPFLTQAAFFATPVFYAATVIPAGWRTVLGLNPMAGVVEGFRWALFDDGRALEPLAWVSIGVTGALLVLGFVYFQRVESTFADVI